MKDKSKNDKETKKLEPNFSFFISTLGLQASIFLGIVANPTSNKKEKNLPQAKFIINTLEMLKIKTKNNLTSDEEKLLSSIVSELKTQFTALEEKKEAK